jgi:glycosyltransferase involved in cell wall biosynthesis
MLVESLPEILNSYPDLILDIAGSGTTKEMWKLKKLVGRLNLVENVEFHGWIDQKQLSQLLISARLLVLPSWNENFGLVVAEALSAGVPCVVSKFVGTSDIIAKHNAGEVINQLTPAAIAAGVIKVLNGYESVYRTAAFNATREDLDWSKIYLQWEALIKSVALE